MALRVMGPQSERETLVDCARAAETAGLDEIWIADHIAIPPDDAEGSEGRYLDPLTTLAYLAAKTERIAIGTGVLILPYRPPLPTVKAIATVQELSGCRLLLGVGVGWMEAEFRALGVSRRRRGRLTDEALSFYLRCFASDEVERNGQRFLFRPRPARPPIFVGGSAPHALERAARFGEGWMPIGRTPAQLSPHVEDLRARFAATGKRPPEVVMLTSLDLSDPTRAAAQARAFAAVGVTRLVHGDRYADASEFRSRAERLGGPVRQALERSV
jgi:probable F420-dependent oxidoreductase